MHIRESYKSRKPSKLTKCNEKRKNEQKTIWKTSNAKLELFSWRIWIYLYRYLRLISFEIKLKFWLLCWFVYFSKKVAASSYFADNCDYWVLIKIKVRRYVMCRYGLLSIGQFNLTCYVINQHYRWMVMLRSYSRNVFNFLRSPRPRKKQQWCKFN